MPNIGKHTQWHLFRPESGSQHAGGFDALTRGVYARIFDDFEDYASDAAIQAVWSGTNVTVTRSTAANAVKGGRSMNVAVAGGTGNVNAAIDNNIFTFPVGSSNGRGRVRYVAFKIIADSGSQTTDVRLGDASDATLYREWRFTVAQDKTRDFIIDLYSGSTTGLAGGGYLNTESYPAPNAEGATAWDASLIDQMSFRNLTDGRTYRMDDIRFFYEYSLLDAIGFGTESASGSGDDGSVHSKLRALLERNDRWLLGDYDDFDSADADANTARWNTEYIADSDGGAAGTEGGTADINTTAAGQARVSVDPDATPTRAAYAISRELTSFTHFFTVAVDATVVLNNGSATSTFAGIRISNGVADDASNYVLIARERSSTVDRITAQAEFGGVVQTEANTNVTDNSVAFKIERYENVWNLYYSTTQYPNWAWTKLTQFEDTGNFGTVTTCYLYAESGGSADAQTAVADFDNWKYYLSSATLDVIATVIGENTANNIYSSANVVANRDGSVLERLEFITGLSVIATGTLTTSSATVPADTGRTEANNYWNASWLMTIAGAIAFQPRLITSFANAGGVFTLDAQQPFTDVPGLVEYVILSPNSQLAPAVDATTNTTPAHVVGNKSDAIPAMNAAPGTDSIVAHAKAILERLGATPADPDDSVLTNIGQRDDTATADDISDVTTTSIQAKLRRLLLRFSSDAFSATIQGAARTDVENMLQALANYLSSAGAAWSVTANPGGTAKDNLEQTLEDFADMLAGATGIVTFPAAAVAGNGVSIAEVLRYVTEAVGEDSADNTFASTLVVANRDGSVLERLENIVTALGTDGTTPVDSATNLQGSIGIDNANNAFASTNVVANRDGSVLERLEDIRTEADDTPKVYDVVIYPVAEDLVTTVLSDDGSSPAFMPAAAASTTAGAGAPATAWSEDIQWEQEGTISVLSLYIEAEWQTRFLLNAGTGTDTASRFEISRDGGVSWVAVTDTFTHSSSTMTARIRAGVGNWITSVVAGANQLQFRLLHWVVAADGVSASEAQIRSNSYCRLTMRKS